MSTLEKSWESKHYLWALLGPVCIILSLSLIILKPAINHIYLPFAAILGIYLCHQWKWRGFAGAIGILIAALAYISSGTSAEVRLWEAGLGLSIAIGFAITALSVEEAKERIQNFLSDISTDQTQLAELQSMAKSSREQIQDLEKISQERLQQVKDYEHIVAVAREELIFTRKENEKIFQELIQKRHLEELAQENLQQCRKAAEMLSAKAREDSLKDHNEISLLKQKVQECCKEAEMLSAKAREDCSKDRNEISLLKQKISVDESESAQQRSKLQKLEMEIEALSKLVSDRDLELNAYKHRVVEAENLHCDLKAQLKAQSDVIQELKQKLETSEPERTQHWQAMRKAEGLYQQLRDQFEEKSQLLNQVRQELFHTQEQLSKYQRDKQENDIYGFSQNENGLIKHILNADRHYNQRINTLENEIQSLQSLIDHLI